MGDNIFALFRADGLVQSAFSSDNIDLLENCCLRRHGTSLFARFLLCPQKSDNITIFLFPVGKIQAQTLPNPIQAHLHALSLSVVTLSAVRNVSHGIARQGTKNIVPDPQRQKRQRHRIEVRGLHLGHLRALKSVLVRRFALDRDVAPA